MKTKKRSAFQVLSRKLLRLSARLRVWQPARLPARRLSPIERRRIAYYELGQAFVASALSDAQTIGTVSLDSRRASDSTSDSGAGRGSGSNSGLGSGLGSGRASQSSAKGAPGESFVTRGELETQLSVLLGGRAAEEVAFGQVSTGAAHDIRLATQIAYRMVTVYGMESCLGPVTFLNDSAEKRSEQTQREIDECIREILSEALNRSIRVLRINRKVLDEAAKLLVEKSKLTENELGEFIRRMKPLENLTEKSPHPSFKDGL